MVKDPESLRPRSTEELEQGIYSGSLDIVKDMKRNAS
jgi:hypothetical protein